MCRSLQEADFIVTQLFLLMTNAYITSYTSRAVDFFVNDCATDLDNCESDMHHVTRQSSDERLLKSSPYYLHFEVRLMPRCILYM